MNTLQQDIREREIGWFKKFRLTVAENSGQGGRQRVGGYDSLDEAKDAARVIRRECDRLIKERFILSSDPAFRLYFWIEHQGAIVFEGDGFDL